MKLIIPTLRLDDKQNIDLTLTLNRPVLLVRAQDLICKKSLKFNDVFHRIKSNGGIHSFLNNYQGIVILSFVMQDRLIKGMDILSYAKLVNTLAPDMYLTPDGETYFGEPSFSILELRRIASLTKKLINLCPYSTPMGQVKGANLQQAQAHFNFLKSLGMNYFTFHSGDFFRCRDKMAISEAKNICTMIKNQGGHLLLYGFGSQKKLEEYSFVDGYITFSHVITAQKGFIYTGRKRQRGQRLNFSETAKANFGEMEKNLINSKNQAKLFAGGKLLWAEASELHPELIIQGKR